MRHCLVCRPRFCRSMVHAHITCVERSKSSRADSRGKHRLVFGHVDVSGDPIVFQMFETCQSEVAYPSQPHQQPQPQQPQFVSSIDDKSILLSNANSSQRCFFMGGSDPSDDVWIVSATTPSTIIIIIIIIVERSTVIPPEIARGTTTSDGASRSSTHQ